jgi:hypothetical protein
MYETACTDCEIKVPITTEATLNQIRALLRYDKSNATDASRGRALVADIPALGLRKKDRLEPSSGLHDVGAFCADKIPFVATFWRRTKESMAGHRNPLFQDRYVARVEMITVDELHTMHLGVYKYWVGTALCRVISSDAFGICHTSGDTRKALTVARIRSEMLEWSSDHRRRFPDVPIYPLSDLVPTMIHHDSISAKAAETGSMKPFTVHLLKKLGVKVEGCAALVAAGEALLQYHDITRLRPRRLSGDERQEPQQQMFFNVCECGKSVCVCVCV